jgi:hypothetical protein
MDVRSGDLTAAGIAIAVSAGRAKYKPRLSCRGLFRKRQLFWSKDHLDLVVPAPLFEPLVCPGE